MKKTLLIALLLIVGVCFGQTYDQIEETYESGLPKVIKTYKVVKGKLQLVKEMNWYSNGQKSVEGKWSVIDDERFGKHYNKNGKWTFWYKNGVKSKEGSYSIHLNIYNNDSTYSYPKHDKWTYYYENGQKKEEGTYKDGEEDGKWTSWHDNGQKKSEITYKDGMVYVAGGTFQMGSNSGYDNEKPVHTVTVSSFYMDATEVTQAEYRKVMGKNPSRFSGCDDCPVEQVSWHDANEYAKKVGKRLPTEAEWEYAARGGNKSKGYRYSGSNTISSVGWYDNNSSGKPHPVAQKQPNELGLYDMSGNVWEWCSDWYGEESYSSSPQNNPQGPNSGSRRVLRGGSWPVSDYGCRVANRLRFDPDSGNDSFGFRLVLSQD